MCLYLYSDKIITIKRYKSGIFTGLYLFIYLVYLWLKIQ